jgi:hypothetical protein
MPEVVERVTFLDPVDGTPVENPQALPWAHKVKCRLPERHYEVAAAIKNLSSKGMPVEVLASECVVCNLTRQKKQLAVHLLNYDVARPQEDILVKINAARHKVASVYAHVPEAGPRGQAKKLHCELRDGYYDVGIEKLDVYCCLEVRLK